jgi:hypothetical protein
MFPLPSSLRWLSRPARATFAISGSPEVKTTDFRGYASPSASLHVAVLLAVAILPSLLFPTNPAAAQGPLSMTPEQIYLGQPPLTNREIPVALEVAGVLAAGGSFGETNMRSLSTRYGLSYHRIFYIAQKCFLAAAAHAAGRRLTDKEIIRLAGTPLALPTSGEEAVIRPYLDELAAVLRK